MKEGDSKKTRCTQERSSTKIRLMYIDGSDSRIHYGFKNEPYKLYEGSNSQHVLNQLYTDYRNDNYQKDQEYPISCIKITPPTTVIQPSIGVIGGMGPMATHYFLTQFYKTLSLPTITCMYTKAPDRKTAYMDNTLSHELSHLLTDIHSYLKDQYKCQHIVMACNTAHIFLDNAPGFISLIQSMKDYLRQIHVDEIMVLASDTTIKSGLYNDVAKQVYYPSSDMQHYITSIIYSEIKAKGHITHASIHYLKTLLAHYIQKGITTFGLCCTELPMVADHPDIQAMIASSGISIQLIDPMQVLIQRLNKLYS